MLNCNGAWCVIFSDLTHFVNYDAWNSVIIRLVCLAVIVEFCIQVWVFMVDAVSVYFCYAIVQSDSSS